MSMRDNSPQGQKNRQKIVNEALENWKRTQPKNAISCECKTDFNNGYTIVTDNCEHKPKFRISYYNPVSKKHEAKTVCGVHKRALQMNCSRLDRLLNENITNFAFTKL